LYWVGENSGVKYFAIGNCTGQGVSRAILSVIALSFLNYILLGKQINSLREPLQEHNKKWIEAFQQGIEFRYNND
jgi:hypothetical protein